MTNLQKFLTRLLRVCLGKHNSSAQQCSPTHESINSACIGVSSLRTFCHTSRRAPIWHLVASNLSSGWRNTPAPLCIWWGANSCMQLVGGEELRFFPQQDATTSLAMVLVCGPGWWLQWKIMTFQVKDHASRSVNLPFIEIIASEARLKIANFACRWYVDYVARTENCIKLWQRFLVCDRESLVDSPKTIWWDGAALSMGCRSSLLSALGRNHIWIR